VRRRILGTVVAVTAIAVVTLFVPAALAVRSRDADGQQVELQRDAAVAAAGLPVDHPERAVFPVDAEHRYGLYRLDGTRVAGRGPVRAEPAIRDVVVGGVPPVVTADDEVVTALLVRSSDPSRSYVLRVAESRDEARRATTRSVLGLGAAALTIIGVAASVAWLLAARLARPLEALGDAAARLDDGDFTATATTTPTGIAELDDVAAALTHTGQRVRRTLERERAFSADVSHQLRTPLSALRTAVEAEQIDPRVNRSAILDEVLDQVDRLAGTLDSLLRLARDTHDDRHPIDLAGLVRRAATRWAPGFADAGRTLELVVPDRPPRPAVSAPALEHVLDVLLENALAHGWGTVGVRVGGLDSRDRDGTGGAAVLTVTDEGRLDHDAGQLFARRPPGAEGNGIGLHLARTLVEAEGGRLRATSVAPTTFELTLPLSP
jgi:signal transduction histidine kinase